jgi:hypothetical protein
MSLELGCYFRQRIYVLQIDNQSWTSEMDVVTAHELLHAVWSKMSLSAASGLTMSWSGSTIRATDDLRAADGRVCQDGAGGRGQRAPFDFGHGVCQVVADA